MASVSNITEQSERCQLVHSRTAKMASTIRGIPSVAFVYERALVCLARRDLQYALCIGLGDVAPANGLVPIICHRSKKCIWLSNPVGCSEGNGDGGGAEDAKAEGQWEPVFNKKISEVNISGGTEAGRQGEALYGKRD